MVDDHGSSWETWAHRVLGDIERIDADNKALNLKLNSLCVKLAILETKAATIGAIWGAIVGAIVAVMTALIIKNIG